MIHIDFSDGTSAWLTDTQMKEQHPELYARLRQPAPHKEHGHKLRNIRTEKGLTVREMAKLTNCKMSYLCDVELGRIAAPMDLVEEYQRLNQRI